MIIRFLFMLSLNLSAQDKFNLAIDNNFVLENSNFTMVRLLDNEKINKFDNFSGYKPIQGILVWNKPLSNVISPICNVEGNHTQRIIVKWCLITKDINKQLDIEEINMYGMSSDQIGCKDEIEKALASVQYNYYSDFTNDNLKTYFVTVFKNSSR